MELSLKESLHKLEQLSPAKLDETSRRIRTDLAGAEWKMAICLLAAARTRSFRALGYSTITEYAEKTLHVSGQKAGRLLSAARALEHLPLLSDAFRRGKLCWGKLRAINGLVSPETEAQWLQFALSHTTHEVVRKVALSPRAWKKHRALKASLAEQPVATPEEAVALLNSGSQGETQGRADPLGVGLGGSTAHSQSSQSRGRHAASQPGPGWPAAPDKESAHGSQARPDQGPESARSAGSPVATGVAAGASGGVGNAGFVGRGCPPGDSSKAPRTATARSTDRNGRSDLDQAPVPSEPTRIRVLLMLTPDQFALFERAESRARARAQKRLSRAEAVCAMARSLLEEGTARSRARHQVVIHTDGASGAAWYETEKGPLPVDPEVLAKAKRERPPLVLGSASVPVAPETPPPPPSSRSISRAVWTERDSESMAARQAQDAQAGGDGGSAQDFGSMGPGAEAAQDFGSMGPGAEAAQDVGAAKVGAKRKAVPTGTLRALHAMSGQSCQRCGGRRGPFEAHHTKPISDGGTHDLATLRLLCRPCHSLIHESDFAKRLHWASARAARMSKVRGQPSPDGPKGSAVPDTS